MTELADRVAIVLGGESGIGLAISEQLAAVGATVVIGGILPDQGSAAVETIGQAASYRRVDVRDVTDIDGLVDAAVAVHGRLDILVYSVGVSDGFSNCLETGDALWDQIIDINLRGCFFACRAALRIMKPQGYGRIVNIASIAASRPASNGISYVAAKFGMVGLTRHIAASMAEGGVVANAICPGVIDTGIRANSSAILGDMAPDMAQGAGATPDGYKRFVPAGRRGLAGEVAALATYLVSDAAAYINGQAIGIDGGWSAT